MQKAKSISTLKLSTYTSTPYKIKNTHSESGQKNNYSVCSGGDGEDRTLDLYTASVALSQLSYAPI